MEKGEQQDREGKTPFTERASRVLTIAQEEALYSKSQAIEPTHLILSLLDKEINLSRLLVSLRIDPDHLRQRIRSYEITKPLSSSYRREGELCLSDLSRQILLQAQVEAKLDGAERVDESHLFLAIFRYQYTRAIMQVPDNIYDRAKSRVARLRQGSK